MASIGQALRELTRDQCLRLLDSVEVGRVGVSIDALPVILPVNFAVADDLVIFRTVPGTKLDAALMRAVVAFEADDHAADGSWGWSVLVRGYAHELHGGTLRQRTAALRAWAFPRGEATHFVAVEPTLVTGRGFGTAPGVSLPSMRPRAS